MKKRLIETALTACALVALLAAAASALPEKSDPDAPCYGWPAVDMDGDGVYDRLDHCVSTPKGCTVDQWGCHSDSDGDGVCDGVDQCPNTPSGMKVDPKGCHAGAGAMKDTGAQATEKPVEPAPPPPPPPTPPASKIERQLLETGSIRLENVYFETASAVLLPESEETLREVGETIEKFPDLQLEVQGHTDTRGSNAYNMKLSQSRSESVRDFLLAHFQLKPENLKARGYGESQPETAERNEEEMLRNRRVMLKALNPDVLPRGVKVEGE